MQPKWQWGQIVFYAIFGFDKTWSLGKIYLKSLGKYCKQIGKNK